MENRRWETSVKLDTSQSLALKSCRQTLVNQTARLYSNWGSLELHLTKRLAVKTESNIEVLAGDASMVNLRLMTAELRDDQ